MDGEQRYKEIIESVQRVMAAVSIDEMSAFDLLIQAEKHHGADDNELLIDDAIRFGSYRWN